MDPNTLYAEQLEGQGFKNAPLSKLCVSVILFATFSAHFLIEPQFLSFDYEDIFINFKFLRLFVSLHCFARLHQAIFAAVLLYKFRQIERNCGSVHFLILLCCHAVFSVAFILVLLVVFPTVKWDFGPIPLLYGFFVPYFSIPVVGGSRIWVLTNKTLTYLVGMQIGFFSENATYGALLGIVGGLLTKYNAFWCRKWFSFLQKMKFSSDTALVTDFTNFPATLEAQNTEMVEEFQRRMMSSPRAGLRPVQIDQEAVTRLVEMGFARELAVEALRNHNNNVDQAIVSLLTRPQSLNANNNNNNNNSD